MERLIGMLTIFVKDSPNSPYQKDFRADPHGCKTVCESAFGAAKQETEEIRKNQYLDVEDQVTGNAGNL